MSAILSRRELLRRVGLGAAGLVLAACQPKVVEVEKVVTQEVVKEVEKVVKETIVVEKEVQAPEPTRGPVDLVAWSLSLMDPDAAVWKPYQDSVHQIMADVLPDVTVTFKDMGWEETLRQNLVTGLLGGTAPDIIVGESLIKPYARMGAYLPLDDPLAEAGIRDNLIPATYENAVADGKMYGVSLLTSVMAFVCNPNVVEKAGLDPSEWPTTWSQFLERIAAITQAGNNEFFGLAMLGPVGYVVGGALRWNALARTAGATMCKNDCNDPHFDDPKLEGVLAFVREINRYTPPGLTWNPAQAQVDQSVYKGTCAYGWAANQHYQFAKEHKIEDIIQYEAIPIPDEGGINATITVANVLVQVLSGTKHPHESVEFIKILTRDEVTDHIYVCSNGRSPSTYSGLARTLPKIVPQHKVFFEILDGTRGAQIGILPQWPKATDKVWTAFNEMMTKLLSTEDSIPALQSEAQANAEKAIAEAT